MVTRPYDLFIKHKKTNSRGSLAGSRRSTFHFAEKMTPLPPSPLLLPHPPFPSHLVHPWGGSLPFPGNKSGTWPAGFDVYFSRPSPRCLAFFCVRPGTTSPPHHHHPSNPLHHTPPPPQKTSLLRRPLRLTPGQGMSCT